jgi:phosphoribosylaminoimidazolecarboxamide formyltransferase/IMP cyclohydrolase
MAQQLCRQKTIGNKAFHVSSHYDTSIFNYFNTDETIFKASIADGKTEIWKILIKRILLW